MDRATLGSSANSARIRVSEIIEGLTRLNELRNLMAALATFGQAADDSRDEALRLTHELPESGREACTLLRDEPSAVAAYTKLCDYLDNHDEKELEQDARRRRGSDSLPLDCQRMLRVRRGWEGREACLVPGAASARATLNRTLHRLLLRKVSSYNLEEVRLLSAEEWAARDAFDDAIWQAVAHPDQTARLAQSLGALGASCAEHGRILGELARIRAHAPASQGTLTRAPQRVVGDPARKLLQRRADETTGFTDALRDQLRHSRLWHRRAHDAWANGGAAPLDKAFNPGGTGRSKALGTRLRDAQHLLDTVELMLASPSLLVDTAAKEAADLGQAFGLIAGELATVLERGEFGASWDPSKAPASAHAAIALYAERGAEAALAAASKPNATMIDPALLAQLEAAALPAGAVAIDEPDAALLAFLNKKPSLRRKVSDVLPDEGPQDRKAVAKRLRKLAARTPPLVDYPKDGRSGVLILPAGAEALKRATAPTPH